MEKNQQNIIDTLRKRVQQDAQRKSQKIKAQNAAHQISTNNDHKQQNQNRVTNIFANLKKPEQNNLFGGQRKSVNLFQMKPKPQLNVNGAQKMGQNIFNIAQKPCVQNQDSNDDKSVGSQQIETQQKSQHLFKSEPDVKVMKYQYKNQLNRLLQLPIRKFKNGTELARQQIYVTLQNLPNQPSALYLVVRTNTTKVIVYQGIMLKNIAKMEHFMGKLDNLKFVVLKKNNKQSDGTNKDSQQKLRNQIVKLQFLSEQNCEEFMKTVNKYFQGQKTN